MLPFQLALEILFKPLTARKGIVGVGAFPPSYQKLLMQEYGEDGLL
jgi:hypothetical protein